MPSVYYVLICWVWCAWPGRSTRVALCSDIKYCVVHVRGTHLQCYSSFYHPLPRQVATVWTYPNPTTLVSLNVTTCLQATAILTTNCDFYPPPLERSPVAKNQFRLDLLDQSWNLLAKSPRAGEKRYYYSRHRSPWLSSTETFLSTRFQPQPCATPTAISLKRKLSTMML
ncbi:hypothetical protein J3E74DRAFT_384972 [Bipolaris maydis]|nr:hypothetical protein J3E74DRAFT_384972 [Bipolaris maydis]